MGIDWQALVNAGEDVPDAVQKCATRFAELGTWCQFSRNEPALSCQDAAQKRRRLGHKGIPLCDELKSFLGEYDNGSETRLFLAHCRGDRELDLDRVRQVLKASESVRRASLAAVARVGTAYGVVNPFLVDDDVAQIFDIELQQSFGVPGTVMTNAGEHTWAVEFDPIESVEHMSSASWASIVSNAQDDEARRRRVRRVIGVLTGNPCDSGLELCAAVNANLRELMGRQSLGDVSMPRIVLVSTPQIGISMEMDRREAPLRRALLAALDELCAMGANIIAHPAHTTHYFEADLEVQAKANGAQFVSMAKATEERVRAAGVKEIALLGTRFVTDPESPWSVYRGAFRGLRVHRPSPAGWKKIHDLGYEVQQKGPTPLAFNWMRDLLRDEVPKECQHVVLAMTEFAPVVRQLRNRGRHGKILMEPIDIYGEAIARQYLSAVAPERTNERQL